MGGRLVHEGSRWTGPSARLRRDLQHLPYRDIAHHLQTIDRYTSLAARQMRERGTQRRRRRRCCCGQSAPSCATTWLQRRLARRRGRAGRVGAEQLLRVPEIREALGRQRTGQQRGPYVFSLHIDTARSWRGGQNQVLLTARGLRARGHRVVVVAHPDGELRRRLPADMDDLVPLAPRTEVDLPAAWRLSRVIRRAAPGRHPRARSARRGRRRARRCRSRRPTPRPGARRRAPGRLPPQGQLVLARGSTGRSIAFVARVGRHPRDAAWKTASPADRASSRSTRASTSTASPRCRAVERPRGVLVPAALADRRQHRRARAAQGTEVPGRCGRDSSSARCRTRAS